MKFKFRFESLLKHRERIKDLAMAEFAEAQRNLDLELKKLDELYTSLDQNFIKTQEVRESGGVAAEMLKIHDEFFTGLEIRIEEQKKQVREKKEISEEKHKVFVQASIEAKSLEKLKEKQKEEARKEKAKKDLLEIEDIVNMRTKTRDQASR